MRGRLDILSLALALGVAYTLSFAGCTIGTKVSPIPVYFGQKMAKTFSGVPIVSLIATPEHFAGKRVTTVGYLAFDERFEGDRYLCPSKSDVDLSLHLNCIIFEPNNKVLGLTNQQIAQIAYQFVQVEGQLEVLPSTQMVVAPQARLVDVTSLIIWNTVLYKPAKLLPTVVPEQKQD